MSLLRLALCLIFFASLAHAGAWPREKGRAFSANSIELIEFDFERDIFKTHYFSSFYMEYGLTESLTIGLHTGHGSMAHLDIRTFLRFPIGQSETHKFAMELSTGYVNESGYLGLGVQYGRGLTFLNRHGWLSVESRVEFGGTLEEFAYRQSKLDVTLGLSHPSGVKTMAQLMMTAVNDDLYTTFAPVLVVPLWKRTKLETGLMYDMTHGRSTGLKIGVWQEF